MYIDISFITNLYTMTILFLVGLMLKGLIAITIVGWIVNIGLRAIEGCVNFLYKITRKSDIVAAIIGLISISPLIYLFICILNWIM